MVLFEISEEYEREAAPLGEDGVMAATDGRWRHLLDDVEVVAASSGGCGGVDDNR